MTCLQNKVALVTGGARGIGAAIVQRFFEEGAHVHVLDMNFDDTDLRESEHITFHVIDVTKSSSVEEVVKHIRSAEASLDILVNNAGILRDNVIWKMPEEDFDAVIAVNLKGPWLMCKAVAPIMREQKRGRIVNIASRAWLGNPGQSNYSASKGGLVSLTRVLALELARSNVTVNAIAPGLITTPMTQALPPEVFQKLVEAQPGKAAGTPHDVAAAVAFLASDEAAFINGQVIHVDGGKNIGANV